MKKNLRVLVAVLTAVLPLAAAGCLAMPQAADRHQSPFILVRFRPHASIRDIEHLCRANGLEIVRLVDPPFLYQLRSNNPTPKHELLRILHQSPLVQYVEEDLPRQAHQPLKTRPPDLPPPLLLRRPH